MKILRDLIEKTHCLKIQGDLNTAVSDITADSREVKKGSLFICLCGAHVNGHDFAAKAAAQGAVAIVAQEPIDVPDEIAVVYVEDTREAMEDMAPFFFDYPSRKMRMIALTGTNGKTKAEKKRPGSTSAAGTFIYRSAAISGRFSNAGR